MSHPIELAVEKFASPNLLLGRYPKNSSENSENYVKEEEEEEEAGVEGGI